MIKSILFYPNLTFLSKSIKSIINRHAFSTAYNPRKQSGRPNNFTVNKYHFGKVDQYYDSINVHTQKLQFNFSTIKDMKFKYDPAKKT
jgi:hypothetical protein